MANEMLQIGKFTEKELHAKEFNILVHAVRCVECECRIVTEPHGKVIKIFPCIIMKDMIDQTE